MEHGLNRELDSPIGPWDLEPISGVEGCDGEACQLDGWKRWTQCTPDGVFTVRNKLWFFNSDSDDPTPGGAEYSGNQHSTEAIRLHAGTGRWDRTYTYSSGSGDLAGRGVRANLYLKGRVEAELKLVNTAPECATGACVAGEATAKMTFETNGLSFLAPELRKFFENRVREDEMQEWHTPSPNAPETLRRKGHLALTWCASPTQSSWNFGVAFWPPGFEMGTSGPDGNGCLKQSKHTVIFDKDIKLCIRPPAHQPNGEQAAFTIIVDAEGDTRTELIRTQLSEATARVE
jgi:hypothetical protein